MIKGIGLDIVELERIEKISKRSDKFVKKVLSLREQAVYDELPEHRKREFLGGRFAAKEAFSKALGTGLGAQCPLQQIEILPNIDGAPILYFYANKVNGFVSITHTENYAAAQVIILN